MRSLAQKNGHLSWICEEKRQNIPVYGVLVGLRWRSLSGLGYDEMLKFNATNVVLNPIRLAAPSVKVGCEEGGSLEKFGAEKRQIIPVLRCSS